jgi:glutathione S-transferase
MIDEYFDLQSKALPRSQAEMLLQYAQSLVQQEQALARQEQEQLRQGKQLAATQERVEKIEAALAPPEGRVYPQDWIVASRKPRLDAALWKSFLDHARTMERAVPYTPPGGAFPRWYYTSEVLERAYVLATRQTLMALVKGKNIKLYGSKKEA